MNIYITTMYKFADRSEHSYILGAYANKEHANLEADKEERNRGGKYKSEIILCPVGKSLEGDDFETIRQL